MSKTPDLEALQASLAKAIGDSLTRNRKGTFLLDLEYKPKCDWKEGDRIWFLNNPRRTYRLRRIELGELPESLLVNATHAIVKQIASGVREKLFFTDTTNGKHLDAAPEVERLVFALWQAIDNGGRGQTIPFSDIFPTALASEETAL